MEIGLSTLYMLTEPFSAVLKRLPLMNTRFVELVDDGLHKLSERRVKLLRDVAQSHDVSFSVHAPFAGVNIASPDRILRNAVLKRLKKSIVYTSRLDGKLWVFHPGVKTALSYFYPKQEWRVNLDSVRRLLRIAEEHDVEIAIENVPEPYPFLMKSVEDFKRFYDELGEDMGLVLDIAHANLNGQITSFLKTFRDRIVHMHVSDNHGKDDVHLGIGQGTINWKKVAKEINEMNFEGKIIVESVEEAEESVERMRKLFF